MKAKLTNLVQWLIMAVISLLGFSACASSENQLEMYGTPTADYKADGRVTDEDGNPVKGIEVKVALTDWKQETATANGGIVYSDKNGSFTTAEYDDEPFFSLTVTDVDGAENGGEFESQVIDLTKMKPVLDETNAKGWHRGVYVYNVQIQLTKKSANNE